MSWLLVGGVAALLFGLFLCFPYLSAVLTGTIVRKGARRLRVRRSEDPDGFAGLLANRQKNSAPGLALTLLGGGVLSMLSLAAAGVEAARVLVDAAIAVGPTTWFGIGLIAYLAFSFIQSIASAIKAKRFGLRHAFSIEVLITVIGLIMMSVFFYGWFSFPDAPFRPCAGPTGYCGKGGAPHTASEYARFDIWQGALLIVSPIGILTSWILNQFRRGRDADDHRW